jgi:hypothetical protein
MNIECPDCSALHWIAERISTSSKSSPQFSRCCKEGGVKLPNIKPLPEELKDLYISQEPLAVDFRHNICSYNCALAFTSVSYTDDTRICDGLRPFQIQGQLCHLHGPLLSSTTETAANAQVWLVELGKHSFIKHSMQIQAVKA